MAMSSSIGICITLTTTDKLPLAKKIAHTLVQTKLAKCVQIHPVTSVYEWKGEVVEDEEYRLIIKSPSANVKAIETAISSMHDYEVPQIITLDASGGSEKYLEWLKS